MGQVIEDASCTHILLAHRPIVWGTVTSLRPAGQDKGKYIYSMEIFSGQSLKLNSSQENKGMACLSTSLINAGGMFTVKVYSVGPTEAVH